MLVGILGAGEIVEKCHLPALRSIPDLTVAWVLDQNESRLSRVGSSHQLRPAALLSRMAQITPVEVVLVALPYGARAEYYSGIRKWTSGVYIEKPLFCTTAEHVGFLEMFPNFAVAHGFQRRFSPAIRMVRNLVTTEIFGKIREMAFAIGGPTSLSAGSYGGNASLARGGLLFESGVHWIDLALYCCRARSISRRESQMLTYQQLDVETTAVFSGITEQGDEFQLKFSATMLKVATNRLTFRFERAEIDFNPFSSQPKVALRDRKSGRLISYLGETAGQPMDTLDLFRANWIAFLGSLSSGRESIASASTSLVTTQAIEMCYSSQKALTFGKA